MSRGTPNMVVRLNPDLRAALAEIARKEGKTMSDLIREALYALIQQKEKAPDSHSEA